MTALEENEQYRILIENTYDIVYSIDSEGNLTYVSPPARRYGFDPDRQPDIYGKIGNAGVSICTLDDVKVLYDGFELCAPNTSVSMTINGPDPIMLAMFFNAAIDDSTAACFFLAVLNSGAPSISLASFDSLPFLGKTNRSNTSPSFA